MQIFGLFGLVPPVQTLKITRNELKVKIAATMVYIPYTYHKKDVLCIIFHSIYLCTNARQDTRAERCILLSVSRHHYYLILSPKTKAATKEAATKATMKNAYLDSNPAVLYFVDKQRFGEAATTTTSENVSSSKDQAKETSTHEEGAKPKNEEQPAKHAMIGPTLEQKFRRYLAAFDGKKKDFSEVENLFDALFHTTFSDTIHFRHRAVSREQTKALHAIYFAMGTRATLIHYRRVGLNTIDASYRLLNDQEDIVTRQLITRQNVRIVRIQQVSCRKVRLDTDDVCDGKQYVRFTEVENSTSSYMKARCKSSAYAWLRMLSYSSV